MRILALAAVVLCSGIAHAEGEYGPMIGGSLIATQADDDTEVAGAQLELALWRGHFGLAVEGAYQAGAAGTASGVTTLGGSARVLLYRQLTPSLLEPREDVELGFEAHGIVERAWWNEPRDRDPVSYGAGLVIRLRGGTDFSNIMAESRLFIRVLTSRATRMEDSVARTTMPLSERDTSIVIGLGAVFGGGDLDYVRRFGARPLDSAMVPVN